MEDLRTTISFKTTILVGDEGNEVSLEIEIDRFEDIFKIIIDGKEVGYGDYQGNLLDMIRTILITEQPFRFAEFQEELRLNVQQQINESNEKFQKNTRRNE